KRRCGIERKRSTSQDTKESAVFPVLESSPKNMVSIVLIVEARPPTNMLRPSPSRVLTNISLPIQSVPNGCSREGARFLEPKLVCNGSPPKYTLETTIASNKSEVEPIIRRV